MFLIFFFTSKSLFFWQCDSVHSQKLKSMQEIFFLDICLLMTMSYNQGPSDVTHKTSCFSRDLMALFDACSQQHTSCLAHYSATSSSMQKINISVLLSLPSLFQTHPVTPRTRLDPFSANNCCEWWARQECLPTETSPCFLHPWEVTILPDTYNRPSETSLEGCIY